MRQAELKRLVSRDTKDALGTSQGFVDGVQALSHRAALQGVIAPDVHMRVRL